MLTFSAADVDRALTFPGLVETLRTAFREGAVQPVRHHHTVDRPDGAASTLLLMPAWTDFRAAGTSRGGHIGVKVVTVSPDNNAIGKPAVMGLYLLLDGKTGEPQALIDGQRLTQWRTACASALAATYLAREDASKLLVIGAGALCPFLARAHAAVRPIREIRIWNRTPANAEKAAAGAAPPTVLTPRRRRSRRGARLGRHRLVGHHLDRRRWSAARAEARRACRPRRRLHARHARGGRRDDPPRPGLCRHPRRRHQGGRRHRAAAGVGRAHPTASSPTCTNWRAARSQGRGTADEITLFKSVGAALEDLAAGIACSTPCRRPRLRLTDRRAARSRELRAIAIGQRLSRSPAPAGTAASAQPAMLHRRTCRNSSAG